MSHAATGLLSETTAHECASQSCLEAGGSALTHAQQKGRRDNRGVTHELTGWGSRMRPRSGTGPAGLLSASSSGAGLVAVMSSAWRKTGHECPCPCGCLCSLPHAYRAPGTLEVTTGVTLVGPSGGQMPMLVHCMLISSHAPWKGVLGRARSLEGLPLRYQRLPSSPCRHPEGHHGIMILSMVTALINGCCARHCAELLTHIIPVSPPSSPIIITLISLMRKLRVREASRDADG